MLYGEAARVNDFETGAHGFNELFMCVPLEPAC
jgi:hypothetical protein